MKALVYTQAYNAEKTLARTMDSVLNQTFTNLEYYVLDNGSNDRTREIIWEYAARDSRVFPLYVKDNDPAHGSLLFQVLSYATDVDYLVWLDADDTYSPDFLEKMIPFAAENQLDLASCGYDMIDGKTGQLLKHKALPENLILTGREFADQYVLYRSFMMVLWGKVYSIPFMREMHKETLCEGVFYMFGDAIYVQSLFQKADRAGIYGEALHQYYQYPKSTSRLDLRGNIKWYHQYYLSAQKYLEHYGPVSKRNEDYLRAIYLSLVEEAVGHIFESDLPPEEKLDILCLTFREPLWAETLAWEADPEFRNLAARAEYVAKMKKRVQALVSTPEEQALAEAVVCELDKPIAGEDAHK